MNKAKSNPGYVDSVLLDAAAEITRPAKLRSYQLMGTAAGHRVLDVGCGPATDTIALAGLVGPTGRVTGIDYDEDMVRKANERAARAGVADRVAHDCGQAPPLPYETASFDAVRSERAFQHMAEPASVLAEMARVTKPGGRVVVTDTDHSGVSIDCEDAGMIDIEWRLRRCRADMPLNGYAGRQLYRLFKTCGLHDPAVECFPLWTAEYGLGRYLTGLEAVEQLALKRGAVTRDELKRWRGMLERMSARGVFSAYGIMLLVAGRKA